MLSRKKKARNGGVAHFILALHDTKRAHCRHVHRTLATQMHYTGHCGTVHGARVVRWEVLRVLAVIGAKVGTRTHPQSATQQDSIKKRTWYLNYFNSYYAEPLLDRIFLCKKRDLQTLNVVILKLFSRNWSSTILIVDLSRLTIP